MGDVAPTLWQYWVIVPGIRTFLTHIIIPSVARHAGTIIKTYTIRLITRALTLTAFLATIVSESSIRTF